MNYLYQITNLINNKIYVGVHKTDNIDDSYMGSGKIINRAIKKYGIENFKKEILEFYDTYKEALAREAEIVTDEFLLREDVYNLRRGGQGGFDYINRTRADNVPTDGRIAANKVLEEKYGPGWRTIVSLLGASKGGSVSNETRRLLKVGIYSADNIEKSRISSQSLTAQQKRKDTYSSIRHQQGEQNSQFGKCWITNEIESKSIKKEQLADYISLGWRKGRILRA